MDFVTQVNSIKDNVLRQPKYNVPIQSVIAKANEYTYKKNLEEKMNSKEDELIR